MIAYICVGVDDMDLAEQFYCAFLPDLGYQMERYHGDLSFVLAQPNEHGPALPEFYVKRPFNGQAAAAGNGTMIAFEARTQAQVRTLHAAALNAGGSNEGAPGFRDDYGPRFYVGYLRDPQGNKIALYSSNPDEPGRDDPVSPV